MCIHNSERLKEGDSEATLPAERLGLGGSDSENNDNYEESFLLELIDTQDVEEKERS